jgi:hypothetical protein
MAIAYQVQVAENHKQIANRNRAAILADAWPLAECGPSLTGGDHNEAALPELPWTTDLL